MVSTVSYRFGEYRLDPQARELRRADELLVLPASAFDCLVYLVEHRERAVGRDELIAAVWGRIDVSDKLLGQTIVRIRRAFGDTGSEQHSVRTVARFGYRWVAETTLDDAGHDAVLVIEPESAADPDAVQAASPSASAESADGASRRVAIASICLVVFAVLLFFAVLPAVRGPVADTRVDPPVSDNAAADTGNAALDAPAMVLPATVVASEDWSWLSLGMMDLVASRLRRADLPTASTESVVALMKQQPHVDGDRLDDRRLAPTGTLRVHPTVRLDGDRWIVLLDTAGDDAVTQVRAESDDVLIAARRAADALLIKLGRTPPVAADGDDPEALDEHVYRINAALFADQLELAARLIDGTPDRLRKSAQIVVAHARLQMRSGDYGLAEAGLRSFLDGAPPALDPATRAKAYNTLAAIHLRQDRADDAEVAYSKVIELLGDHGERGDLAYAYLGRGLVAVMRSQQDQGVADLGLARIEMEAAGDAYGAALVDLNLALTDMTRHRVAEAIATLDMATQRLQALGAREDLAYARIRAIDLRIRMLQYDEALAASDDLWPPEANSGNLRLQWRIILSRARALSAVGRIDEANVLIARIGADSDPTQDSVIRAEADALAAELALQEGRAEDAATLAASAMTAELRSFDSYVFGRISLVGVRALLQLGRTDDAEAAVRAMAEWAQAGNDQWRPIYASLAQAELAWAGDDRASALALFETTAQIAQRANGPEDMVTVVVPYIHALIDAGHLERAGAVSGRIVPWAERDFRVAWTQARLYRAMDMTGAWQQAVDRARSLAGERTPTPLESAAAPDGLP